MNTTGAPFVVIGCGDKKREGTHAAVDLYAGPLYLSRLAYARALGGPHAILSGLYGLIEPGREVPAYNFRLSERSTAEREHWIQTQAERLLHQAGERHIVVLAAGEYLEILRHLPADRVTVPARGLPIGKQRAELGRLTRELGERASEDASASGAEWLAREFDLLAADDEVLVTAGALREFMRRRAV